MQNLESIEISWNDYLSDKNLLACSFSAQGLWFHMLFLMQDSDHYGRLLLNGNPMQTSDLARLTGGSTNEVKTLLEELERNGVFTRIDETIVCRRMIWDAENSVNNSDPKVI